MDDALVVDAAGFDGFYGSGLDVTLRNDRRTQLVMVGFAAEVCVDSTLRSANDQGYECLVVADACAPLDPDIGHRALRSVTMSGGIFGAVGTTASLYSALVEVRHNSAGPGASSEAIESEIAQPESAGLGHDGGLS